MNKIVSPQYLNLIQKYGNNINLLLLEISNILHNLGKVLLDWSKEKNKDELTSIVQKAIEISSDEWEFFYNTVTKDCINKKDIALFLNDFDYIGGLRRYKDKKLKSSYLSKQSVIHTKRSKLINCSFSDNIIIKYNEKDHETVKQYISSCLPHYNESIINLIFDVIDKIVDALITNKKHIIIIDGNSEILYFIFIIKKVLVLLNFPYCDKNNLKSIDNSEKNTHSNSVFIIDNPLAKKILDKNSDAGIFENIHFEMIIKKLLKNFNVILTPINNKNLLKRLLRIEDFECEISSFVFPDLNNEEIKDLLYNYQLCNITYDKITINNIISLLDKVGLDNKFEKAKEILNSCTRPYIVQRFIQRNEKSQNITLCIDSNILKSKISQMYGVKFDDITKIHTEETIHNELSHAILGQDEAIKKIAPYINIIVNNAKNIQKGTLGAYLFLGPSGVGKSETAKEIACLFFDGIYHKEDMNTYTEPHTVLSLKGAPPSYIGYYDKMSLLSFSENNQKGVVILDEIEKAHPVVLDFFMEVIDNGFLNDSKGKTYDVRNFLFICTSNAIIEDKKRYMGFDSSLNIDNKRFSDADLRVALTKVFKPEIIGRFNLIVRFNPLSLDSIRYIAKRIITNMLQEIHYIDDSLDIESLINESIQYYTPNQGVRPVKAFIDNVLRSRFLILNSSKQQKEV